jgi:hypothetical protein
VLFFLLFQVLTLDKLPPVGDYNLRSRVKKAKEVPEAIPASPPPVASPMANNRGNNDDNPLNDGGNLEDNANGGGGAIGNMAFVPRTLKDYHIPRADNAQWPILLPALVGDPPNFGFGIVNLIQQNCFHGLELENPHDHLNNFIQCCQTVKCSPASMKYVKLALFPFSLKDKTKVWFNSLPKGTVGTWPSMSNLFLAMYYPVR